MSILELIFVSSIMGIVFLGVGSVLFNLKTYQSQLETRLSLESISQKLNYLLKDEKAWEVTFVHADNSTNFSCLSSSSGCSSGSLFSVYDRFNSVSFNGNLNNLGFTANAQPCDDFPSDECRYKLKIEWEPGCLSTTCGNVIPIHLKGTWSSNNTNNLINLNHLNVHVTKLIKNTMSAVTNLPKVSFDKPFQTMIQVQEGAVVSFNVLIDQPAKEDTPVSVCEGYGSLFSTTISPYDNMVFAAQNTMPESSFNSGSGYTCTTHIIPKSASSVAINKIIYDDTITTNNNIAGYGHYLYLKSSSKVDVGVNNQFGITVYDNDNYFEIVSTTLNSTDPNYIDISYRSNLTYCGRLFPKSDPFWSISSTCAISTGSTICFLSTGNIPVVAKVSKTCLWPGWYSGEKFVLRAGNLEAINQSNDGILP